MLRNCFYLTWFPEVGLDNHITIGDHLRIGIEENHQFVHVRDFSHAPRTMGKHVKIERSQEVVRQCIFYRQKEGSIVSFKGPFLQKHRQEQQ